MPDIDGTERTKGTEGTDDSGGTSAADNNCDDSAIESAAAGTEPGKPKGSRRKARFAALQLLYARELKGESPGLLTPEDTDTLREMLEIAADHAELPYLLNTVREVERRAPYLDGRLTAFLKPGWSVSRLSRMDRLILRLMAYEMIINPPKADDPYSILIAIAVELVKQFSAEESLKFINGVLASLARELTGETAKPAPPSQNADNANQ
jgi:N utilization substance protein B